MKIQQRQVCSVAPKKLHSSKTQTHFNGGKNKVKYGFIWTTKSRLVLTLIALSFLLSACFDNAGVEAAKRVEQSVEEVVSQLAVDSSNWQELLERLAADLEETGSEFTNDVEGLIQRSTQLASAEVKCSTDFIADKVESELRSILNRIRGKAAPALQPHVCSSVPNNITLSPEGLLSHLSIGGYNLNNAGLGAFVESSDGSMRRVPFNTPSFYNLTITFGSSGVQLRSHDVRIVLRRSNFEELVSIGIFQPELPICKTRVVTFRIGDHTVRPNRYRTNKDRDFDGKGPRVNAHAELEVKQASNSSSQDQVMLKAEFKASETGSIDTMFSGKAVIGVYSAPTGWKIIERLTPAESKSTFSYIDVDHSVDRRSSASGPASQLLGYGDRHGDDWAYTRMTFKFRNAQYKIKQSEGCRDE